MNLRDLLDELRVGMLNDATDRVAGTSDYLWTDARLVRYINEAQRRFAVQGLVIRDNRTPEVTQITLVAGQQDYPLHESVIAVMSARKATDLVDLRRVGHAMLSTVGMPNDTWYDPVSYTGMAPGSPQAYSTEEGLTDQLGDTWSQATIRFYPVPDAAAAGTVIKLQVVRKPLDELTVGDLSASPEIPEDHHLEMLDWAAYLALRIVDDDAGNPKRAADFAQSFEAHVTEARKLAMRKLFAPMPWGFGRGGFTWENGYGG